MNEASMKISLNKIKLKPAIYIFLSIFLLVAVRWIWHDQLTTTNRPTIEQGVLDLKDVELEHLSPITLDGEWLFFPGQWVSASNINNAENGQLLQVPGNWNSVIDPSNKKAYGYGTYYLHILLASPLSEPLTLSFQSIY